MIPEYPVEERRYSPPAPRSLVGPILLIGAGGLLLAANLGWLPDYSWRLLGQLWPLMLIVVGFDIMVGRRSAAGAWFSGMMAAAVLTGVAALLWLAPVLPGISRMIEPSIHLVAGEASHPRTDITEARIAIDFPSGGGTIVPTTPGSSDLIEAQTLHTATPRLEVETSNGQARVELKRRSAERCFLCFFDEEPGTTRWDVALAHDLPLALTLDASSGSHVFDLATLQLESLVLNGSSGEVVLMLPAATYTARIDGGSGSMNISIPTEAGLRVERDHGSGTFVPGERLRMTSGATDDDSVWETENFRTAAAKITIRLDQGSGDIIIE